MSDITLCKVVTSDPEPKDGIHFSSMRTLLLPLFTIVAYVEPHRTINADITDTLKWYFFMVLGYRGPAETCSACDVIRLFKQLVC